MSTKNVKSLLAVLLLLIVSAPAFAQSNDLQEFLLKKGYVAIKLNKLIIGHLYMEGTLNGVKGKFILDSGAGATVIDEKAKDKFKLNTDKGDNVKAAGAGSSSLSAKMVTNNKIVLGNYKNDNQTLAVMNLDNVNDGLKSVGIAAFDGVIGADILSSGKAVIDYPTLTLYLVNPSK